MVYSLWDTETHNLVAESERLDEALGVVLRGIERNGPQDTDTLALEREDDQGRVTAIAHGQELASLARREMADRDKMAR